MIVLVVVGLDDAQIIQMTDKNRDNVRMNIVNRNSKWEYERKSRKVDCFCLRLCPARSIFWKDTKAPSNTIWISGITKNLTRGCDIFITERESSEIHPVSSLKLAEIAMDLSTSSAEHMHPYDVSLLISKSDLIPVADVFSSDPFWKVYYDKRYIGETLVFKRHLTAEWKQEFRFRVPSISTPLELRLYDDDEAKGKDDDFMGNVIVPLNGPANPDSQTVNVELTDKYAAQNRRTTLEFTLNVSRTDLPTIRLVSSPTLSATTVSTAESLESWLPPRTLSSLGKITRRLLEEYNSLHHPSRYEILELINDVLNLKSSYSKPSTDNSQQFITRKKLVLETSTKVSFPMKDLSTITFERHSPIESNSIQLNLNSNETHFYLFTFENRFIMWHWFKWFSLALQYWKLSSSNSRSSTNGNINTQFSFALPSWTKNKGGGFTTQVMLQSHKAMNKSKRISLKIDLNESFQLLFDNVSVEVDHLDSLILSIDSKVPCQWVTELTVTETDNEMFDDEDNYVLNNYFISNAVDSYRVKSREEFLLLDVTNESTLKNATSDFLDISTFEQSGRSIKLAKQGTIDLSSNNGPVLVLDKKIGERLSFLLSNMVCSPFIFLSFSLFSLLGYSITGVKVHELGFLEEQNTSINFKASLFNMQTKCEESEKSFLLAINHGEGEVGSLNIDLFPEHFVDQIEYVKIELRDSSDAAMVYGSCFIPVSSFTVDALTHSFPISRFGCSPSVLSFYSSNEIGYGSLEVTFQKKLLTVGNNAKSRQQSLYIRRESYLSTVYNTRYLVECVQSPSSEELNRAPSSDETFLLQVTSESLILSDISECDSIEERLSSAGSELSLNATKGQNVKEAAVMKSEGDDDADEDDELEFEHENEENEIILYENEKFGLGR
jgi:hypothetical protein